MKALRYFMNLLVVFSVGMGLSACLAMDPGDAEVWEDATAEELAETDAYGDLEGEIYGSGGYPDPFEPGGGNQGNVNLPCDCPVDCACEIAPDGLCETVSCDGQVEAQ